MIVAVKLIIAAFISVHQYIPGEDTRYTKYYSDVRNITEDDVFPAAHESCKYLISVFAEETLKKTLDIQRGSQSSQELAKDMTTRSGLSDFLEIIIEGEYGEKFKEHDIDPLEIKKNIIAICSNDFSPLSFTPQQRKEVLEFVDSEIKVLSDVHLNSLGDFNYFGSGQIFDRTGETVGSLDAVPRTWAPYHNISKNLTLALLATEDDSYFEHKGVDSKAIARIAAKMMEGGNAAGGSTITMQLLKNMYFLNGPASQYELLNTSSSFSTLLRKVREWYWAWPFEKSHVDRLGPIQAKEYILELYFNLVDLGPRIQGVEQASYVYFGRPSENLELAEASFITTLLKAPSRYSSEDNYVEYTEPRRNDYILSRILEICNTFSKSRDTGAELKSLYQSMCSHDGKVMDQAFIEEQKKRTLPSWTRVTSSPVAEHMTMMKDQVQSWIKDHKFNPASMPKEIEIQTTINQDLQKVVFESVRKKLDEYDGDRGALTNVRPAYDDTSRIASFKDLDVDPGQVRVMKEIIDLLPKEEKQYLFSFKIWKEEKGLEYKSVSLDVKDVLASLSSLKIDEEKALTIARSAMKDMYSAGNRHW